MPWSLPSAFVPRTLFIHNFSRRVCLPLDKSLVFQDPAQFGNVQARVALEKNTRLETLPGTSIEPRCG